VANEVENRRGGGTQQAERLRRRGGAAWSDGFDGNQEEKGISAD
jgi:hypothetical protein